MNPTVQQKFFLHKDLLENPNLKSHPIVERGIFKTQSKEKFSQVEI